MKLADIQRLSESVSGPVSAQMQAQVRLYLQELGYDPDHFYQELEMNSPYVDTHQDVSYSNSMMHLHSHSFYELLYCRSTGGAEYLVGSQRYRLHPGDIVIVPPGVSHRPLLPEPMAEPYRRDVLWISPDFMERLLRLFPGPLRSGDAHPNLLRTAGSRWEALGDLFQKGVTESRERQPGWEAAVIGNTVCLLTQLKRALDDPEAPPPKAEQPDLLDQVIGYIESHLCDRITLTDAARHFFVSEGTIALTLRRKMNISFHRCLTQRRLITAKTLITSGVPLDSVAEQVGFQDYSTFYRAFRQEYGISPRQFRSMAAARPDLPL